MKPAFITEEHMTFLDALRESGVTNMFGAGPYLQDTFGVDRRVAKEILLYWMQRKQNEVPK